MNIERPRYRAKRLRSIDLDLIRLSTNVEFAPCKHDSESLLREAERGCATDAGAGSKPEAWHSRAGVRITARVRKVLTDPESHQLALPWRTPCCSKSQLRMLADRKSVV